MFTGSFTLKIYAAKIVDRKHRGSTELNRRYVAIRRGLTLRCEIEQYCIYATPAHVKVILVFTIIHTVSTRDS
jgi:hypothetical protein